MKGIATAIAVLAALASAWALYVVDYDSRRLAQNVGAKEREIDQITAEIAVLRAERAHLARPDRIEPVARTMGLQSPEARQLVPLRELPTQPAR